MVETLDALPEALGEVGELLADASYFSEANVAACVEAGIDPLIATGRESHHLPWQERFSEPPPLCEPADAVERMRHRLKTRSGRASYGKRKQTVSMTVRPTMVVLSTCAAGAEGVAQRGMSRHGPSACTAVAAHLPHHTVGKLTSSVSG
jgi:hypothetical protein